MEFVDVGLGIHAPCAVVLRGEDGLLGKLCLSAVVSGLFLGFLAKREVLDKEIGILIGLCAVLSEVVDDGVPSLLRHVHPKFEGTRPTLRELRLVYSKENPETIKFFNDRIVHNFKICHVPSVLSDTSVRGL